MKQFLLFLLFLCSATAMRANNGDDFISLKSGFLFPNTANAAFSYERGIDHDTYAAIFGEIGSNLQKNSLDKDYYWGGGFGCKTALKRYKNSMLYIEGEMHAGAHVKKFFFGAGINFEYAYTFRSGLSFTITQKNQVNFLHNDTFKNGLLFGIKIPI